MSKDAHPRTGRHRMPEWGIVSVVYLLAHGLMLLDRGLFWDDWAHFRQPAALLESLDRMIGSIWPSWLFAVQWRSLWSVWTTRTVVFFAFLAVALIVLRLLKRVPFFDAGARVALASLVAVFPVMGARDAIANSAYPISLALFFAGWCLIDACVGRRLVLARLFALAALFLSLRTASLGLFYVVVPVWLLWRDGASWRHPREVASRLLRWVDVLAVPVVFLIVRWLMGRPSGLYEGYNEIALAGLLGALPRIPAALYNSFIAVLGQMPRTAWWPVALLAGVFAGYALWPRSEKAIDAAAWWRVSAAGLVLLVLGVYPYLAVGKMPALGDFSSRHQLLVPFGAALLLVGVVSGTNGALRLPRAVGAGILAAVIGLGAGASAANHLDYQREWYKQLGMIAALRSAPEARAGRTFLFEDRSPLLNATGRTYKREYEYTGLFAEAFGTHVRFGADRAEYEAQGPAFYRARLTARYKLDGYREAPPDDVVFVDAGPVDLRDVTVLARLVIEEWTAAPSFGRDVAGTVRLTFQPLR